MGRGRSRERVSPIAIGLMVLGKGGSRRPGGRCESQA